MAEEGLSLFLKDAQRLPGYSGWQPGEIRSNIKKVVASGDREKIKRLSSDMSKYMPGFRGWGDDEISSILSEKFKSEPLPPAPEIDKDYLKGSEIKPIIPKPMASATTQPDLGLPKKAPVDPSPERALSSSEPWSETPAEFEVKRPKQVTSEPAETIRKFDPYKQADMIHKQVKRLGGTTPEAQQLKEEYLSKYKPEDRVEVEKAIETMETASPGLGSAARAVGGILKDVTRPKDWKESQQAKDKAFTYMEKGGRSVKVPNHATEDFTREGWKPIDELAGFKKRYQSGKQVAEKYNIDPKSLSWENDEPQIDEETQDKLREHFLSQGKQPIQDLWTYLREERLNKSIEDYEKTGLAPQILKTADILDPIDLREFQIEQDIEKLEQQDPNTFKYFKEGRLGMLADKLVAYTMAGDNEENIQKALALKDRVEQTIASGKQDEGMLKGMYADFVRMAGPMVESMAKGVIPVVGKAWAASDWVAQGTGEIYADLRKAGVTHETAKMLAPMAGMAYAAVEKQQVTDLLSFVKGAGKKKVKNAVVNYLIKYGKNVASESLEEGAQELVKGLATVIGKSAEGKLKEKSGEITKKLALDAGKAFVQTLGPMMIGGAIGGAGRKAFDISKPAVQKEFSERQDQGLEDVDKQIQDITQSEGAENQTTQVEGSGVSVNPEQEQGADIPETPTQDQPQTPIGEQAQEPGIPGKEQAQEQVKAQPTEQQEELKPPPQNESEAKEEIKEVKSEVKEIPETVKPTKEKTAQEVKLEIAEDNAEKIVNRIESTPETDEELLNPVKMYDRIVGREIKSDEARSALNNLIETTVDPTSGLPTKAVFEKSREFLRNSGRKVSVIVSDLRNLGGLNAFFQGKAKDDSGKGYGEEFTKNRPEFVRNGKPLSGHEAADVAIKKVVDIIESNIKDFKKQQTRVGGDEFAAIALDVGSEQMASVVEKIESEVADYVKSLGLSSIANPKHDGLPTGFGIDIGVDEYLGQDTELETIDSVIANADNIGDAKKIKFLDDKAKEFGYNKIETPKGVEYKKERRDVNGKQSRETQKPREDVRYQDRRTELERDKKRPDGGTQQTETREQVTPEPKQVKSKQYQVPYKSKAVAITSPTGKVVKYSKEFNSSDPVSRASTLEKDIEEINSQLKKDLPVKERKRLENIKAVIERDYSSIAKSTKPISKETTEKDISDEESLSGGKDYNPTKVEESIKNEYETMTKEDSGVKAESGAGMRLLKDFGKKSKRVDLRGHQVKNTREVAELFSVYRHPNIEQFQIVYTKGKKILAHNALSSGLPGATVAYSSKDRAKSYEHMKSRMKRLGADGYYLIHNHPSGDPSYSQGDVQVTSHYRNNVKGFKGHIILDHNRYSAVYGMTDDGRAVAEENIPYNSDLTYDNNPFKSITIRSARDVAKIVSDVVNSKDKNALVVMGVKGEMIDWYPIKGVKSKEQIRQLVRQSGGNSAIITTGNNETYRKQVLVSKGSDFKYLQDIVLVVKSGIESARKIDTWRPFGIQQESGKKQEYKFLYEESSEYGGTEKVESIKPSEKKIPKEELNLDVDSETPIGSTISYNPGKLKGGSGYLTFAEDFYFKAKEMAYPIIKIRKVLEQAGIKAKEALMNKTDYAIDRVRGAKGIAAQYLEDNYLPILKQVDKLKLNPKERGKFFRNLSEYLVAKRTAWLYENKENHFDSTVTKEDAKAFVEKVESGNIEHAEYLQGMAKEIWNYTAGLKKIKLDKMVIDSDFFDNLSEPYYVPFYRDVEQTYTKQGGTATFTTTSTGIKKISSSSSDYKIIDPIQLIKAQTVETIVNGEKAELMHGLIELAEENPNVLGDLFIKLPRKRVKAGTIEHRKEIDSVMEKEIKSMIDSIGTDKVHKVLTGKRLKEFNDSIKKLNHVYKATEGLKAHELGHLIDKKFPAIRKALERHAEDLINVADSRYEGEETVVRFINYVRKKDEKIAEFISMYITDRTKLAELAPGALAEFEQVIQNIDQLKDLPKLKPEGLSVLETDENWMLDRALPMDEDVVSVRRGDKIESYRVPIEMAQAIKNLHPEQLPAWLRYSLTIPARMLRAGAVGLNPDFIIPNVTRDQIDAAFNARSIPVIDWFKGVRHYLAQDEVYKAYNMRGGSMESPESGVRGFHGEVTKAIYGSEYGKFLDPFFWKNKGILKGTADVGKFALTYPFKGIQFLAEMSEMGTRLGVMDREMKHGSIERAVHEARQSTLDFNRFGYYGRTPNEVIPFLNAALEGLDRFARTWKDKPLRSAMYMASLWMTYVGMYAWNKNNENYKNIGSREKSNNWIIMTSATDKNYVKIPKGHITKLLLNPVQAMVEIYEKQSSQTGWDLAVDIASDISPIDQSSIIPVTLKLIIEPIANYDFYWKKEIEKDIFKQFPAGYRHDKRTGETMKAIGKALNISPIMLKHEFKSLFAGGGSNFLWLMDYALGKIGVLPPAEVELTQTMITRRFLGKAEEWQSDIAFRVRAVNERIKEIEKNESRGVASLIRFYGYKPDEIKEAKQASGIEKKKLYKKKAELLKAQKELNKMEESLNDRRHEENTTGE